MITLRGVIVGISELRIENDMCSIIACLDNGTDDNPNIVSLLFHKKRNELSHIDDLKNKEVQLDGDFLKMKNNTYAIEVQQIQVVDSTS